MFEMTYLRRLPTTVPPDRCLVHNNVQPARRLGTRGFRAWLVPANQPGLAVCGCGWAPELGPHFRPGTDGSCAPAVARLGD
jgi:hypothetical protein